MSREIKSPEPVIATDKSFDGKHEIQFNEKSHRYKWLCDCHAKAPSVGVTTFLKSSMPTSVGLTNWMKSQSVKALFNHLATPDYSGRAFLPSLLWPIGCDTRDELFKKAVTAHEAVAQEAADVGTICHGFAELDSLNRIGEAASLLSKVRGAEKWPIIDSCIRKYLAWKDADKGELVLAEGLVASPTYIFCGKFDRLDKVNGKLRLRDYKTSKSIYLENYIQLGAYAIAIKEWLGLDVDELEILRFGKDDGEFETLLINDPAEVEVFKEQAIRCRKTFEFTKLNNDPRFDWKKK